MPINNTIYGTSEQWFVPPIQANQSEERQIKMVNFADVGEDEQLAQWEKGVLYNKIQVNEMPDKSIAFGLLPVDSAYNNLKYFRYTNNEITETNDIQDELIPIYYCYTLANTSTTSAHNEVNTEKSMIFSPDVVNYENNGSYITQPVATAPYQNVIALPRIIAYSSDYSYSGEFTIAEYEQNKTDYPNPIGAYFQLFIYGIYTDYRAVYSYSNTGDFTNQSLKVLPLKYFKTPNGDILTMRINNSDATPLFGYTSRRIFLSFQYYDLFYMLIGADKFTVSPDVTDYRYRNIAYNGSPDDFIAETKRQMSMFGIPFALDLATAQTGTFDSENMCIPITNNGIGTGDYTQGTGNKDNPAYSWTEQRENSGVDVFNPDTNNYVDDTPTFDLSLGAWRVFNRSYIVDADTLDNLASFLWLGSVENEGGVNVVINALKLMGANPLDAIISLRFYPFNISSQFPLKQTEVNNIIIGNAIADGVTGELIKSITGNNNIVLDLGNAKFPKYFDNFLDYSPYTTAEIYIPYCKRINIDVEYFVGKTIDIKLIVDLNTGGCLGCVYSDNVLYYVTEGMIGVEIAVTGANNAQYTKQVLTSALSTSSSLATGNVGGIIGGALDIATNVPKVQIKGGSTPTSSLSLPQNAYLFIHSPIPQIPSTYAHTFGNACSIGGTVGNFSGFTVFSNTDLTGISATDNEKMQIESLLNTGVYL